MCVAEESVYLPHKGGCGRVGEYLERVHIDIAAFVPAAFAGGRGYVYVVAAYYLCGIYMAAARHIGKAGAIKCPGWWQRTRIKEINARIINVQDVAHQISMSL